jgi:hypothetical protein
LTAERCPANGRDAFDEPQSSDVYYEGTWYTVMVGVDWAGCFALTDTVAR